MSESVSGDHGDASPDDPVGPKGAHGWIECMVGPGFPLVEARTLTAQLRHEEFEVAAFRYEVAHGPVGAPDLIR